MNYNTHIITLPTTLTEALLLPDPVCVLVAIAITGHVSCFRAPQLPKTDTQSLQVFCKPVAAVLHH